MFSSNIYKRKIKNRKAAALDEIHFEVWRNRKFGDILLRHFNAVYNQNAIHIWTKGCIPLPLESRPRINHELQRYDLYIHSSQYIKCSTTQPHGTQNWEPKWLSDKSIHDVTNFDYQSNSWRCTLKKKRKAAILFDDFSKAFDSIHRLKMWQIIPA